MREVECSAEKGSFSLDGPIFIDVFDPLENLTDLIGASSFHCSDQKLNEYLKKLKEALIDLQETAKWNSIPPSASLACSKMGCIISRNKASGGEAFPAPSVLLKQKAA